MATTDLVTTDEFKEYAEIGDTSMDSQIAALITAVSLTLEDFCNTNFIRRESTHDFTLSDRLRFSFVSLVNRWPNRFYHVYLPRVPVVSIASIVDPAGNSLPSNTYSLIHKTGDMRFLSCPLIPVDSNGLEAYWTVTYTAGWFADTAAVDKQLKLICNRAIKAVMDQPAGNVGSLTMGSLSVTFNDPVGAYEEFVLTPDSLAMLGPYMNRSYS